MLNDALVYAGASKLFVYNAMSFGTWLREKIKEKGISNAELARRVGVSATYIGNLVRDFSPNTKTGKVRPSEQVVESIAKALGADAADARHAAGYTGKRNAPRNLIEFLEVLESLGLEQFDFAADRAQLDDYTEDDFEELLERIKADVGITLRRKRK